MQDNNDVNAGAATPGTGDSADLGSPQVTPDVSSGTPNNQNGTPTDTRDAELSKYREEVRRLNQAVIDAKRGNRNNDRGNGNNDQVSFDTPEGQYGIAIQLATGNLRNKMEDVISLYPELPADEIARIRKNPWSFVKHETFINADWETAALEVEQAMLSRAEEISASKKTEPTQPMTPANLNTNPVQTTGDEPVDPENDDWNMPLDQLEAKAKKAVARVSQTK